MRLISIEELVAVTGGTFVEGGGDVGDFSVQKFDSFNDVEYGVKKTPQGGGAPKGGDSGGNSVLKDILASLPVPQGEISCTAKVQGRGSDVKDWEVSCSATVTTTKGKK